MNQSEIFGFFQFIQGHRKHKKILPTSHTVHGEAEARQRLPYDNLLTASHRFMRLKAWLALRRAWPPFFDTSLWGLRWPSTQRRNACRKPQAPSQPSPQDTTTTGSIRPPPHASREAEVGHSGLYCWLRPPQASYRQTHQKPSWRKQKF